MLQDFEFPFCQDSFKCLPKLLAAQVIRSLRCVQFFMENTKIVLDGDEAILTSLFISIMTWLTRFSATLRKRSCFSIFICSFTSYVKAFGLVRVGV